MMFYYYIITQRCNLTCSHCIRGNSVSRDMDTTLALQFMDELANYSSKNILVLTGGEPTLHPDFMLFLYHGLNRFNQVILTSNGISKLFKRLINSWHALYQNGLRIQFSIDGDEIAHDKLRGTGSWAITIDNLKSLSDSGIPMWISTVVTKDNIISIPYLRDLLHNYDIEKWHINPVLPFGCGAGLKSPSINEWNCLVDDMLNSCRMQLGIRRLYDFKQLEHLTNENIIELSRKFNKYQSISNCGSGTYKIYIYPDFTVCGCTCLTSIPFGILGKSPLRDIFQSPNALSIRNYKIKDSSPCNHCRYLPLCKGGCIGISLHKTGQIGIGDVRCPLWQKYSKI